MPLSGLIGFVTKLGERAAPLTDCQPTILSSPRPSGGEVSAGKGEHDRVTGYLPELAASATREPHIIVGESPAMREVTGLIRRLAPSDITVLIQGEPGTGKELVARTMHQLSPRAPQPFVSVNLATIPSHLVEAELFGQVQGTGEGSLSRRYGCFDQAHGGTLFLDRICELPLDMQARLLRVLNSGEFFPAGARERVTVDVRLIVACARELEPLVKTGEFREDLYHRLNVIRVRLPPLRERSQDVGPLLRYFLEKAASELRCPAKVLSAEAEQFLRRWDWPGNVRELENTCRRITAMLSQRQVELDDLSAELLGAPRLSQPSALDWEECFETWVDQRLRSGNDNVARDAIRSAESILIRAALRVTRGRKQDAARLLGYGRNTLSRKLAELDFEVD